ncbi:hypothetical protein [Bacillus thuringiensis]|uniref:RipA family octameric membrane protein n=1 Tax=Bacillus thuringiensis TaxID=1428 RepID=UPI001E6374A6|nr:hypothetical protein [Bacillus thuringiensis]MCC2541630.1 hypothetical protein [Bacillus thuringiensis]
MKKLNLNEYKKEFKIEEKIKYSQSSNTCFVSNNEKKDISNKLTKEAHKQALDIRKFEIDMYWKRATYFWTIIGVIFAGYFLLMKDDVVAKHPTLILLLNCIGFIFSLSWYLVNRGSKYWQNNWEKHVDLLEDEVTGPLYKIVIEEKGLKLRNIHKEYGYSVSKINQFLSFFVMLIWLFMGIYLILIQLNINFLQFKGLKIILLVTGTIIAAYILVFCSKSEVAKENKKSNNTFNENWSIRKREIK